MDFSWFIWFGMCLAFWICVSFAKFGEFSAIILWSTFSALPSFSPPGTRWHTFDLLLQSHRSWGLFIFSPPIYFLSLLLQLSNFYCSIFQFVNSSLSCPSVAEPKHWIFILVIVFVWRSLITAGRWVSSPPGLLWCHPSGSVGVPCYVVEVMSRLPTWPLLACVGSGATVFSCGVWLE